MSETIQNIIPFLVVASHAVLVFLVLAFIARRSWGRPIIAFLNKHLILIGFLITLGAIAGSLFYSEVVGFAPCVLCWWQRLFLYPQAVLFGIALWKRDRGVFTYSLALSLFAGILALYHSYVYWGGESLLPCTALGGACSKIYVYEFGYITIPSMSLTVVLYLILLYLVNRTSRSNS